MRRLKLSRLGGLKNGRAASGRAVASGTLATLLALAGAGTAWAHQDPPACSATGVAITFEVLRNDGSPIDLSETVTECELLTYRAMLAKSTEGNPCAFEGGTITITTPDGVAHDVTPSGGVPCVGGTVAGGCGAMSATSNTATYSVRPQDVASGEVTAQVDYMAAFSHTRAIEEPDVPRAHTELGNTVEFCPADTQCTDNFCDPAKSNGVQLGVCSSTDTSGRCDDGVACTTDTCDAVNGCQHSPNNGACDDGVACTTDTCDVVNGCQHSPNNGACDDGVACTTDTCTAQGCQHSPNNGACDDGVACTTDTCTAQGCQHSPNNGACDDGFSCTTDTCDAVNGCQHGRNDAACSDSNACTDDGCDPSNTLHDPTTGCVNTTRTCSDSDPCTNDSCDPATGNCMHTAKCNDNNECTNDFCDAAGTCSHTNVADGSPCTDTDGDACTTPACQAGCCNQRASVNTTSCPITNCSIMYPFSSSDPRTNVTFNESEVLRTFNPMGGVPATPGLTIKLWYNDEHAMVLGVSKVSVKTSSGTTTTNYPLSSLCATPGTGCAQPNPQVGTTALNGDQSGTDTNACTGFPDLCDRPIFPSLFVTDITDPNQTSKAGDWQSGGTPIPPSAVFGSWKSVTKLIDKTKNPPAVTLTTAADPGTKNHWNLGPGSDPVPKHCSVSLGTACKVNADCGGTQTCVQPADEGYGAEARWGVDDLVGNGTLIAGHSYRLEFMFHDGDQNKTGGDVGENCVNIRILTGSSSCP